MLNDLSLELSNAYIDTSYVRRSRERLSASQKKFNQVLKEGALPEQGFPEGDIEGLLLQLASLDSNNRPGAVGVGEREGRVLVNLVRRRHFGLTHGIGRSGDITASQPKAAGSSLLNRLVNRILLHWLRLSGTPSTASCFIVPMATGMSLTLCMLALKQRRPGARFVVWPRIDQKSCFKSILAAGLIPVPIDLKCCSSSDKTKNSNDDQLGYSLEDDLVEAVERPAKYIATHWPQAALDYGIKDESDNHSFGPQDVVCVFSTTSCFAPRVPDRLVAITRVCQCHNVPHLVNNAYGVQLPRCMAMLESAGRLVLSSTSPSSSASGSTVIVNDHSQPIDFLFVQSTDKNLLVPVGGAVVAGFNSDLVDQIAKSYPGRASATPSIDVLATLLHLGRRGWFRLIRQRELCFDKLRDGLVELAQKHSLRLMTTKDNPISLALDLSNLVGEGNLNRLTSIGAQLFAKGCSGVRIVLPAVSDGDNSSSFVPHQQQKLGHFTFQGFNSHSSRSKRPYLNAAAAIGVTESEIDLFLVKLDQVLTHFMKDTRKEKGAE